MAAILVFFFDLLSCPHRQSQSRVATAQGKQGIWLLTFPDRENRGNLVNLFFTQGKWCQHRENLEFFENFVIKVATR